MNYRCPRCQYEQVNLKSLRVHCHKLHNLGSKDLYDMLNPCARTTCLCGCNQKTSFRSLSVGYAKFVSGHNARLSRLSIDEIKERLHLVYGDQVSLKEDTYINIIKTATFIDRDFGEWKAKPYNVLNQRGSHPKRKIFNTKKTLMMKYGVSHQMHIKDVYEKVELSTHHVTKLAHWKTGQILICRASYEVAFINWCNSNQIDFDWQIMHKMPDGRAYYVDAYIKSGKFSDLWIEIKGYHRGDSLEKWEWFHSNHKNSQIWFKKDLIDKGIIK